MARAAHAYLTAFAVTQIIITLVLATRVPHKTSYEAAHSKRIHCVVSSHTLPLHT